MAEERHASWLELFFDLVAVAGIGMLAHLLEEDETGGALAVYVVAFTAFWIVWACFTTYGNIAGEETHTPQMLAGMVVLGVMTAAVPEIREEHARAFAIAYVVGRVIAARPWRQATVVVDLPVVQAAVGVLPWVASWWVDGTARYVLWAVGLALDLLILLTTTRERLLADSQSRLDRVLARVADGRGRGRGRQGGRDDRRQGRELPTTVVAMDADAPHLGERLGLFVLIVLGEGLVQVIDAASEATWDRQLAVTGAGAFALVFALWAVAVRRGYAGVAMLPQGGITPRLAWAAHLCATLALATVAAVLGGLVADPAAPVSDHDRVLAVAAYLLYGLQSVGIHLAVGLRASGPDRRAALDRAVRIGAPVLVSSALVLVLPEAAAEAVVWLLAGGMVAVVLLTGPRPSGRLGPRRRTGEPAPRPA
ncbi:low temperature requirement protein A [Cellulomonas sp. URHB0016]